MTTLLNNKGLSKSEMAVAIEMEILHELGEVRKTIAAEKSDGSAVHTMRLMSLRGKESGLTHILEFMSKNMKK